MTTLYLFKNLDSRFKPHVLFSGDDFQTIASDAAGGIVSLKIIKGEFDQAVNEVIDAVDDIDEQYLTPKLFRQFVSALICQKQICQAVFVALHGLSKFNNHAQMQALLLHMDKYYEDHVKAVEELLKTKSHLDSSTKQIIQEALAFKPGPGKSLFFHLSYAKYAQTGQYT